MDLNKVATCSNITYEQINHLPLKGVELRLSFIPKSGISFDGNYAEIFKIKITAWDANPELAEASAIKTLQKIFKRFKRDFLWFKVPARITQKNVKILNFEREILKNE